MKATKATIFHAACALAGLALLVGLFRELDFDEVLARLQDVGFVFLAAIACHWTALVASTLAWRSMIHRERSEASFTELLAVFWGAHAVNYLTPTGTLGEVMRGTILSHKVPSDELVASVISFNFYNFVSEQVLTLSGPVLCLLFLDLPQAVTIPLLVVALAAFVPTILIYVLLRAGAVRTLVRLAFRLPFFKPDRRQALTEKAVAIDARIRDLAANRPGELRVAMGWTAIARAVQPIEVWALLVVFLPDQSPVHLLLVAFIAQTTSQLVSWAFNFVPGQLGFAEGGIATLFHLLGLDPVAGFSMEFVRRLRMVVTVMVGLPLGFWVMRKAQSTRGAARAEKT